MRLLQFLARDIAAAFESTKLRLPQNGHGRLLRLSAENNLRECRRERGTANGFEKSSSGKISHEMIYTKNRVELDNKRKALV